MSYIQVRDDLDLYEYWKLLAVSADTDEREDYNMARLVYIGVNDPKQLKKWKFATEDKAGTKASGNPAKSLVNMAMLMTGGNLDGAMITGLERARATGRRVVYVIGPNSFVDEQGNPTERTRDDMVLQPPQAAEKVQ